MDSNSITKRSRNWTFTIHDPQDLPDFVTNKVLAELSAVKYYVIGTETCPNTGRKHWQGFLQAENSIRFAQVKKILVCEHTKAHIEVGKTSAWSNMLYCKKGEQSKEEWESLHETGPNYGKNAQVQEKGEAPSNPKRKGDAGGAATKAKWTNIVHLAKKGRMDEIAEEAPHAYVQCYRTLKQIGADSMVAKDLEKMDNYWFYGKSGVGKSKLARMRFPDYYVKNSVLDGMKWWDGYRGQETVIVEDISEFSPKFVDCLKIWSDEYPFMAEYKGGSFLIRPKRIVVTSQYTIEEIWKDDRTRDAMNRRFQSIEVRPWQERVERGEIVIDESDLSEHERNERERAARRDEKEEESEYEVDLDEEL